MKSKSEVFNIFSKKYYIIKEEDKYYVGYKNKVSREYSKLWCEAKKYVSLNTAFYSLYSGDNFLILYRIFYNKLIKNVRYLRSVKLAKLEGEENEINIEDYINDFKPQVLFNYDPNMNVDIEILEFDGKMLNNIGKVKTLDLYKILKEKAIAHCKKHDTNLHEVSNPIIFKSSTPEEVDDFLANLESIHSDNVNKIEILD